MHGLNLTGSIEPITRGDEFLLFDVARGFGKVSLEALPLLVTVLLEKLGGCARQRIDQAQRRDDSSCIRPSSCRLKTLLLMLNLLLSPLKVGTCEEPYCGV